jgi:pre-mRNA 3'-end-processing factor FIP1
MNMPLMPGAPGAPAGAQSGMEGVPPGFQEMFQSLFAQGLDPSQMDPSAFSMMVGGQAGIAQGFGQQGQNQQQMGYGYGGNNNAGGAGNRNQKGHGQNRRQW